MFLAMHIISPYHQFSSISRVSSNSILITTYLEVRVKSHRFRSQAHRAVPTSEARHKSGCHVTCASDHLAINQWFPQSPPWLLNFLEQLTELKKHFTRWQCFKGCNSGAVRQGDAECKAWGKDVALPALWDQPLLNLHMFTSWEALNSFSF